ncbi:hypothetical protein RSAG8_13210, partial [Rhizoctonia solani AG-8 WAC10335]
MACANARTNRTGRLLLDVHITGSLLNVEQLGQWFTFAAPRIKSLTLIVCDTFETYEPALVACLGHCSPGTLSHLTVWKEIATDPNDDLILDFRNPLDYNQLEFEDVFRQLESLRLRQVYPHWTNQIYHGLSELQLASHQSSQSELIEITVSNLILILQSSPKLRVLRLDLKVIEDEQGAEGLSIPVRLDDLEVLDLSAEFRQPNLEWLELVLPLLAPGTKPLQLTIDDLDEDRHLILENVAQAFFARSNVTRLKLVYEQSDYKELDFELLSRLAPQLRHFVLEHYSWGEYRDCPVDPYPRFHERDNSAPNSRVEYLYLHRCDIELEWCPKLLQDLIHPPRVLVFWKCIFLKKMERVVNSEEIRRAFEGVCQDVRILKWDAPKPPDDWASDTMQRGKLGYISSIQCFYIAFLGYLDCLY